MPPNWRALGLGGACTVQQQRWAPELRAPDPHGFAKLLPLKPTSQDPLGQMADRISGAPSASAGHHYPNEGGEEVRGGRSCLGVHDQRKKRAHNDAIVEQRGHCAPKTLVACPSEKPRAHSAPTWLAAGRERGSLSHLGGGILLAV
jgi:hypothetical protein